MDWFRQQYGVPAKRGGRVEYTGGQLPRIGTITGTNGPHLMIRMDGDKFARPFHPTWRLRYLAGAAA